MAIFSAVGFGSAILFELKDSARKNNCRMLYIISHGNFASFTFGTVVAMELSILWFYIYIRPG